MARLSYNTTSSVSTARRRQYDGWVCLSGLRDGVLFDEWYWFDRALHGVLLVLLMTVLEVVVMFADVGHLSQTEWLNTDLTLWQYQVVQAFDLNEVAYNSPFFTALELIGDFLSFSPLAYLF